MGKYERKTKKPTTSNAENTPAAEPRLTKTAEVDKRGAPPGHRGNPPHVPTDENRKIVKALVAYGVVQDDIAKQLDVSVDTLQRHYRREIDTAANEANAKVAERLFKKCMDGDTTSLIFWLKTRAKWSETHKHEHTGAQGGPIETRQLPATDDWLKEFERGGEETPPPPSSED